MNLEKFDRTIENVERVCALTNFNLKYNKDFPNKLRVEFNDSIKNLFRLIAQDQSYFNHSQKLWHTARRIVCLNNIYLKMTKVRKHILNSSGPKYFCDKIASAVLPTLSQRIQELSALAELTRLPFSVGVERDKFYRDAKSAIELHDPSTPFTIEKEYFHLLGNHLDGKKLKAMDTKPYDGMYEVFSLISWSNILEAFVQQGNPFEARLGRQLLAKLQKSMPIQNKLSYAHRLPNFKQISEFSTEISYYKDLIELYRAKSKQGKDEQRDFFRKYTLDEQSPVPLKVLKNEIAWDIVEIIDNMKEGDSEIFVLGTQAHRAAVQITCIKLPTSTHPGDYKYEIFNTGYGYSVYHMFKKEQGETLIRPITFHHLPREALSLSFFGSLVWCALASRSIDQFYNIHHFFLVVQYGIEMDLDCASWHPSQKHGTCSYNCIEAWIDSYLNESEKRHLELTKTRISVEKQRRVVSIWENEIKDGDPLTQNEAKKIALPYRMTLENKLEDSRTLLKLGEEHLSTLHQKDAQDEHNEYLLS